MRGKNTRRVFSDVFRPAVFKTGDGLSLKNSLGPPANLSCLLVRNCTIHRFLFHIDSSHNTELERSGMDVGSTLPTGTLQERDKPVIRAIGTCLQVLTFALASVGTPLNILVHVSWSISIFPKLNERNLHHHHVQQRLQYRCQPFDVQRGSQGPAHPLQNTCTG